MGICSLPASTSKVLASVREHLGLSCRRLGASPAEERRARRTPPADEMSDGYDDDSSAAPESEQLVLKNSAFLLQLVCLASAFVIGLVIKHYRVRWLHEAGATLLLGVGVGFVIWSANTTQKVTRWLDFNEEVFFFLLLPPIIFESGFSLHTREFFSNFGGICGLAFVGTAISTFTVGIFVWLCGVVGICTGLPFLHALIFGALISATDPVTVLAIFQELGVNIDLYSLVFGESVLNDAVAIVMYRTLLNFVEKGVNLLSLLEAAAFFVFIFVGSMLVGTFFAIAVTLFFKLIGGPLLESHPHVETSLVMIAPYCAYATAEALSLSGIVAILFCGIVMAHYTKPNLSAESQRDAPRIWKVLATLAETFVFVYVGVAMFLESQAWSTIPFAVTALIGCLIGRALNVFPVTRQINRWRKPAARVPQNHAWMLFVSGLRGAIAFALASSTIHDLGEKSGRVIRTATLMIIIFTVLVVGGACHELVDRLDLRAPSRWTEMRDDEESSRREGSNPVDERAAAPSKSERYADDDGPDEALMPEFRVENFDEGLARLGAHLGEVRKQEGLDMRGKVRAAAAAVGRVANVATFEDIDSRFIRPYLTVQEGDASRRGSRQGSPTPPPGEGARGDDDDGGDGGAEGGGDEGALREVALDDAGMTPIALEPPSESIDRTPLGLPSPSKTR